jgi:F0F1-type ATP synthase assembly protein I
MNRRTTTFRFTRLTQEYVGGILAGLGLGILLTGYILFRRDIFYELKELVIVGFLLMPIGGAVAQHAQAKRVRSQAQQQEEQPPEKESTPS